MIPIMINRIGNLKAIGPFVRRLRLGKSPKSPLTPVPQPPHSGGGGHNFGGPAIGAIALIIAGRDEAKAILDVLPPAHSPFQMLNGLWNMPTERLAGLLSLLVCFVGTLVALALILRAIVRQKK